MNPQPNTRLICHDCWNTYHVEEGPCKHVQAIIDGFNEYIDALFDDRRFALAKALAVALVQYEGVPQGMGPIKLADALLAKLAESTPESRTEESNEHTDDH